MTVVALTRYDLEALGTVGERLLSAEKFDTPREANWIGLSLSEFRQETEDVELDGVHYPATFNWFASMTGQRRRDGVNFYLRVVIQKESSIPAMVHTLLSALVQFGEFAGCSCTVETPCPKHAALKEDDGVEGYA